MRILMYFISYISAPAYSVDYWWVSMTYSHPTPNTKKISWDPSVSQLCSVAQRHPRQLSRTPEEPTWSRTDLPMVTFLLTTRAIHYSRWNPSKSRSVQATASAMQRGCLGVADVVYLWVNRNHTSATLFLPKYPTKLLYRSNCRDTPPSDWQPA